MARKKREQIGGQLGEWIVTYGDMVTLMLCFFVALFDITDADIQQMDIMITSLNNMGMGANSGSPTLATGKLAELGNTIASLPAMEKGRSLGVSLKKAISLFNPEVKSNKVTITHDERGLVISFAADAFFPPASAELNIEDTREIMIKVAQLMVSPELAARKFRIEGHTDSEPVDEGSAYKSNWELSAARAVNVLHYLVGFGADERRFQVSGFSDTVPRSVNDSPEGRAANRRVDIIILDEGHL